MIFVTVGTHEQPFDRLIRKIDELKTNGIIQEDVFIQTGYSTYEPTGCEWKKMLSFTEMDEMIANARIIVCHAGPSSFLAPLKIGKIPVVVPRMKKYGEHVNDHQINFSRIVSERQNNIIVVEDIDDLGNVIADYDSIAATKASGVKSNTKVFLEKFEQVIDDLMKE